MPYQFAIERQDYSDFAGGAVFHSLPGQPALPVRLVSELFQRCLALRTGRGQRGPVTIYDPCCGSAYHLSTLAHLHADAIARIIASDVNEDVLAVAWRNLDLLTLDGMDRRMVELADMLAQFGKASHAEALRSASRLRAAMSSRGDRLVREIVLFAADATNRHSMQAGLPEGEIDLILSDIPYGRYTAWQLVAAESALSPAAQMLDALLPLISPRSLLAIVADKGQSIRHEQYRRLDRFQIGKRQIVILSLQT